MSHRGIYKLRFNNSWYVDIDGHQVPFPNFKTASQYLDYLNLWADSGEVASYDPVKQSLVWFKVPNVRLGIANKRHRGHRMATREDYVL